MLLSKSACCCCCPRDVNFTVAAIKVGCGFESSHSYSNLMVPPMKVSLPVGFCGMVIGGRGLTVVTGGLTVEGLVVMGALVLVDGTPLVVVDSDVTGGVLVIVGARVLLGGTPLVVVDSDVTVRGLVVVGALVLVDGTALVDVDSDAVGGRVGFTK